jgi:alpha-beta hydrolase superfamily lysophospholipase
MIWLLALLVVYIGLLLLAVRVSLYPVRTPVFISPGSIGAPQEPFEVNSLDNTLIRGWAVRHEKPLGVLVMAHGYLMNRSELTPLAAYMHDKGWASMVLDLRAHGRSGGQRSTMGTLERWDVAAVARLARTEYPGVPIVLVGSSMGAAASAFALADDPQLAEGLIMDSAYSRLSDAVLGWWYFLGGRSLRAFLWPTTIVAWPFVGFNPFRVDVAAALARTSVPVLFVHGDCDTLAEPFQADRNMDAVGSRGEIVWFERCGHSEGRWLQPEKYYRSVEKYLAGIAAEEKLKTAV